MPVVIARLRIPRYPLDSCSSGIGGRPPHVPIRPAEEVIDVVAHVTAVLAVDRAVAIGAHLFERVWPQSPTVRGLGDARLPGAVVEIFENLARMIALVGRSQGSSGVAARLTAERLLSGSSSVGSRVVVSPSSAGWIGAATITQVLRSTACSGLWARCFEPSFIFAILTLGSVLLV